MSELPFTNSADLAQAIAEGIAPLLDRPFSLFGHSMGALASFEVARILQHDYLRPLQHLFVSGCAAPDVHREKQILHNLPGEGFREGLRKLGGIPPEIIQNDELMQIIEPMLRADFAVSETYRFRHGTPLSCPITAFHGADDPYVSHEHTSAWKQFTYSEFHLHTLPGGHFFISTEYQPIAEAVTASLFSRK